MRLALVVLVAWGNFFLLALLVTPTPAAAATLPQCDGTTGPDGCVCDGAGTTIGSSLDVNFTSGKTRVSLIGATHEGMHISDIAYGQKNCIKFNPRALTCERNCICWVEGPFADFLTLCNQTKETLSSLSQGYNIPMQANFSRTTYNLMGDPIVTHGFASNNLEINTAVITPGFGAVDFGLVSVDVLAGQFLAAVPGTDVVVLKVRFQLTTAPIIVVPGSISFSNPAVTASVALTHTTCHTGRPACDNGITVTMLTHADSGVFQGDLSFEIQHVCNDANDCPAISIDTTITDFFPPPTFTRVNVRDVEATVQVDTDQVQPIGTKDTPARTVISSTAVDAAGGVVPSTIVGAYAYHSTDGVPCNDTAPSTLIVDSELEPKFNWISVDTVGLDPSTLTLSTLKLGLSVLATPDAVAHVLNDITGSEQGWERLEAERRVKVCVKTLHEIRPFDSVARRLESHVTLLTVEGAHKESATAQRRKLAEPERGQTSAYTANSDHQLEMDMPPCDLNPYCKPPSPPEDQLWLYLGVGAGGVAFVAFVVGAVLVKRHRTSATTASNQV